MLKNVLSFLDNREVTYTTNEEQNFISFTTRTKNATLNCFGQLNEKAQIFTFYSAIGAIIPENKRVLVAELITRINSGLIIGNFDLDFDDGEVSYKTSIDFDGVELAEPLIRNLIDANVTIADNFFYTIVEGITSDLLPEQLLAKRKHEAE